jgi:hypothetical protein
MLTGMAWCRNQLREATGHPHHLTESSLQALIAVAQDNPDGFKLFFRQSAQEPDFRRHDDELRDDRDRRAVPARSDPRREPAAVGRAADTDLRCRRGDRLAGRGQAVTAIAGGQGR